MKPVAGVADYGPYFGGRVGGVDACRGSCRFGVGVFVPCRADCARLRGGACGHCGRVVADRSRGAGAGREVIRHFRGMVPKCVFENRGMVLPLDIPQFFRTQIAKTTINKG